MNELIIGRKAEQNGCDDKDDRDDSPPDGDQSEENQGREVEEEKNEGTMILDATCAPQDIRFPTDASLLNEAREKAEEIIDDLHEMGLSERKKPRTYQKKARRKYNSFSKSRKKTVKMIGTTLRQQLGHLNRDLGIIDDYELRHPGCLQKLPSRQQTMLQVILTLHSQQEYMYRTGTHKVTDRIVSLSQSRVRPLVRGKQTADVEFGANVEMSVVDGFLRIEDLRWDAFNENTTPRQSVEDYRKVYGHYPARVLADTIFRIREHLKYCKEHGIHLNGSKIGKPFADPAEARRHRKLEWLESGER